MATALCSGSFMCDLIAADLPRIGEPGDLTYAPNGIGLHVGGHAANVAIDLAKMGQRDVAVAGCIGDDALGDFIENGLRSHGLAVYPERLSSVPTSKNIVLVVRGEDRRFYAELAANTMLSPVHVLHVLEETRPALFYQGTVGGLRALDGHVESVLTRAGELGCLTVVDVVRPYEGGWRNLEESLPLVDVLHCNDLEAAALTEEEDLATAAAALTDAGVKLCLITMGADGLVAALGESMLKTPSFSVKTVDPTGAGDAFCAGVITSRRPPLHSTRCIEARPPRGGGRRGDVRHGPRGDYGGGEGGRQPPDPGEGRLGLVRGGTPLEATYIRVKRE
jgi:sugar/nucleoside kinase (ribokinase family)